MSDDDPGETGAAPNCPKCLSALEIDGDVDNPRWVCPSCGLVKLA